MYQSRYSDADLKGSRKYGGILAEVNNGFDRECFFVAPIGEEGSEIRRRSDGILNFIVSRAASELDLHTVRADQLSEPGQINLQVIQHVMSARVVVADLTGLNPNVFYELAVRHTANLPVVLIAERGTDLPFDIAQMRTIFFDHTDLEEADKCRQEIVAQLTQALEGGAIDSPISTAVDIRSLAAGSAIDRSVAELVTTVENLATAQRETREAVEFMMRRGGGMRTVDPGAIRDLAETYDELRNTIDPDDPARELLDKLGKPIHFLERRLYPSISERHGTSAPPRNLSSRKAPSEPDISSRE